MARGKAGNSKRKETSSQEVSNSAISVHDEGALHVKAPMYSLYKDKISPLLDCVDKLRHLKIMQEGIQLPTIVVVGDQSSGKSSVLESLACISLPRGQGICTRVPLIMKLQTHDNPQAELFLEFNGKVVQTDEENIAKAINTATDEIAGRGKGISNTPLTLIVKKNGLPTLTMVDLPGITRVPVHGQPEDIYEQISAIIKEYITPEESIILNVLSAAVDFSICESIRMSQKVDKTGKRTLAVVTKVDKAPEGLLEKVTADDVCIGLGYICVRNRINNESYEDARIKETSLFESHPLLSKISKSTVGIPVLAEKLVELQGNIISKCLPEIVRKINDKLAVNISDLNKLPQSPNSVAESMTTLLHILSNLKESLLKVLVRGEFDECKEDKKMHFTARLAEMLKKYSDKLHVMCEEKYSKEKFLMEEIKVLNETKGIRLPNFYPRTTFLTLLHGMVQVISSQPVAFVEEVWDYIEGVVDPILMHHSENYPQYQALSRKAAAELIAKKKNQSIEWMMEFIEMEKCTDYTCSSEYMLIYNLLIEEQDSFIRIMNESSRRVKEHVPGYGEVEVGHLYKHLDILQQALDVKVRVTAYWRIVVRRLTEIMALHLPYSIKKLVNQEMEEAIIGALMKPDGEGIEQSFKESPAVSEKRNRLKRSIKVLQDSKDIVSKIRRIS